MTDDRHRPDWSPAFDRLGHEFDRVIAEAEVNDPPARRRRRVIAVVVGLGLIGAPVAIALSSSDPEPQPVRHEAVIPIEQLSPDQQRNLDPTLDEE